MYAAHRSRAETTYFSVSETATSTTRHGGISAASALIHRVLLDTEREEVAEEKRRDYKTILQEFVQRTPNQTLSYRLFGESGPDHDKTFYFEVLLNGGAVGKGAGRSKKEAEQMAAKDALEKLTDQR